MADTAKDDPRFEEIQEEVDAIRRRLPHNPGLHIPDPDAHPMFPAGDEDVYPDD